MVVAFLVIGMVSAGYGYELEADVKRFLDNYVKDSTADNGRFLRYKKMGIIPASVELKDLRFRAIQIYGFKILPLDEISLAEYPDTVALSEIIWPTDQWLVLVMAHNKPLYTLELVRRGDGGLEFIGAGVPTPGHSYQHPMWISLLKYYPESTGINPVLVTTLPFLGPAFLHGDRFLYFPQKGPRKIYHISHGRRRAGPPPPQFTGSMENLDDSKKFIAHSRKHKRSPKALEIEDGGQK